LLLRVNGKQLGEIWSKTWSQMWGALLVGVFIFGLAYVYNFSGMAASLAKAFASLGTLFIVVAPILGFIGVALSGSNTSTNAMFGKFQALVGQILGFPVLLLPTVNSIGAEIGKRWRRRPPASASRPRASCATKAKSFVTISVGAWSSWSISS